MVLGLLVIAAIPTVTGVAQGISSKKTQNAQMKEKIKFNMTATLSVDGGPPTEAWIVLRNGRVSTLDFTCSHSPPLLITICSSTNPVFILSCIFLPVRTRRHIDFETCPSGYGAPFRHGARH